LEKNGTIETLIHLSAYIPFCLKFACILKKNLFPPNQVFSIKKDQPNKKPNLLTKIIQFFKNRKKKKIK